MSTSQICILIIASILFIPFLCSLIEEVVKEHINKNKAIKKQNMELKRAYIEMLEEKRYKKFKRINKMQVQNCMIK